MTECRCVCSTFGPGPHDKEARHPNPKACEHAEMPERRKVVRVEMPHEPKIVDEQVPHG